MQLSSQRKLLIVATVLGIVAMGIILLSIIALFSSRTQQPSPNDTTPTTSTQPEITRDPTTGFYNGSHYNIEQSPQYIKSQQQINEKNKTASLQNQAVGRLLSKLPYSGSNFSMSYSYDTNQFTVVIKVTNQIAGNQEFDQFLQNNGISNRSWIHNLVLTYQ